MWINVRTFCGRRSERIDDISKLSTVRELKVKVGKVFKVPTSKQKLFYGGKQLVDSHTLYDYDVSINDTIQVLILLNSKPSSTKTECEADEQNKDTVITISETKDSAEVECIGEALYTVGEEVDVFDANTNAWFESRVKRIYTSPLNGKSTRYYEVRLDGYEEGDNMHVLDHEIRPRVYYMYQWKELKPGLQCLVNHNFDKEGERGFWYEALLLSVSEGRHKKVEADICLNGGALNMKVKLFFLDDMYRIESRTVPLSPGTVPRAGIAKRLSAPICSSCNDNPKSRCKVCSCSICGKKEKPELILMCDECDGCFHLYCLTPPLKDVPDVQYWFCSHCEIDRTQIVQAGERLKKTKVPSKSSGRDWGKGMACQGRTKVCTIVPQTHIGPVPGVPVGSLWKYRLQVSEAGVHRPHVAGIHGREADGAYSIVLSGGYEDDKDLGEEFYYTGSGGRDLSGNKRCAEQSSDQKLSRMNLALARCCAAPLNLSDGAEAAKWREGRPLRVVRSSKLRKHSIFAPDEGNRYDGIYKVVRYWSEPGQSGFLVWRYLLRRDDPDPAPWTDEGKANARRLNLRLIYPEGYLENKENGNDPAPVKRKRLSEPSASSSNGGVPTNHLRKKSNTDVDSRTRKLIACDGRNEKLWRDILNGDGKLHDAVTENFTCICCTELVYMPVTTCCGHNICSDCLRRSFQADVFNCPVCRNQLQDEFEVNENLRQVLLEIFPGYEGVGR